MALSISSAKYSILSVESHRNFVIPKPSIIRIPTSKTPQISIHSTPNFSNATLQRPHCCLSSAGEFVDISPSNIIFVKGLPLSTFEGSLKTAFSQFGEVSRVKIITNKKTRKSLGFAYVWFASREDAELAAKEMNGKALPRYLDKIFNQFLAILLSVTFVLFFGEVIPQAIWTCCRCKFCLARVCSDDNLLSNFLPYWQGG